MNWLSKQWTWLKSFFSEPINGTGEQKGSSKRIAAIGVTYVFMHTYLDKAAGSEVMPDIPTEWVYLLLIVLGVTGVIDYMRAKTEKK